MRVCHNSLTHPFFSLRILHKAIYSNNFSQKNVYIIYHERIFHQKGSHLFTKGHSSPMLPFTVVLSFHISYRFIRKSFFKLADMAKMPKSIYTLSMPKCRNLL